MDVENSHTLNLRGYEWTATLASDAGTTFTLHVEDFPALFGETEVTIRGHRGFANPGPNATIRWLENDTTAASLRGDDATTLEELEAFAEALQPLHVDTLDAKTPAWPPPGGPNFDVGTPELAGTIGGYPWIVDTGNESNTRALYPHVIGVAMPGIDTHDAEPPPGYPLGEIVTAVIGGVMVLVVAPPEIDHATVRLSDGTTIDIAGYHWNDRTGIVVPIPFGLDVVEVDLDAVDGTALDHIDIPEYPPKLSGSTQSWGSLPPSTEG